MAGTRQPIDLVAAKGRKHLTKAEISERKSTEIIAPCDKVEPPTYLSKKKKADFRKIAKELLAIGLVANVDCDALARLIVAQSQYVEIMQQIEETPLMVDVPVYGERFNADTGKDERVQIGTTQGVNQERERLMKMQDMCMKQCRQCATDFGMTVSARCRLIVPKPQEPTTVNKFAKYAE